MRDYELSVFLAYTVFLHRIRCGKLFEAAKIHVQVMRLTKPKLSLLCLHDVAQESIAALQVLLFTKTLRNDVRKFDADPILFREIQFKKMDILMFK